MTKRPGSAADGPGSGGRRFGYLEQRRTTGIEVTDTANGRVGAADGRSGGHGITDSSVVTSNIARVVSSVGAGIAQLEHRGGWRRAGRYCQHSRSLARVVPTSLALPQSAPAVSCVTYPAAEAAVGAGGVDRSITPGRSDANGVREPTAIPVSAVGAASSARRRRAAIDEAPSAKTNMVGG